jgi:non-heme Fe2+,alpha-ketoglutarate-dependent halogenase
MTTAKNFFLTDMEVEQFDRDGVLGPFKVIEQDEMKERWKRERLNLFDRSQAVYPDAEPGSGAYNQDRHLDNRFLAELICRPEITHKAASILGPDVLCWRSEFFQKYPGDEATDWHQADTFGGATGVPHITWPRSDGKPPTVGAHQAGALTAWIALTDTDEDSACMRFIPGTHRKMNYDESKGMKYEPAMTNRRIIGGEPRGVYGYDWRELRIDPHFEPDESKAFSAPCKAGEFMLFWSMTIHSSHRHKGNGNPYRVAFVPRYIPTVVMVYADKRKSGPMTEYTGSISEFGGTFPLDNYGAVLVSGKNEYLYNRVLPTTTTGFPFANHNPR